MNRCEFCSAVVLLAAVWLVVRKKDPWIARGLTALVLYTAVVTLFSPQRMCDGTEAAVRYLVPLIPLCLAIEAQTIRLYAGKSPSVALLAAVLAFGSNLGNLGFLYGAGVRSTIVCFVRELANPPPEPYTPAAQWIRAHVPDGASVWVIPGHMAYPLMFHAPEAVYAWQLAAENRDPQFAGLPALHFENRAAPDYIVAFGPVSHEVRQMLAERCGVGYEQAAVLDCFWRDLFRPELFWRRFDPHVGYSAADEAIYIFARRPGA